MKVRTIALAGIGVASILLAGCASAEPTATAPATDDSTAAFTTTVAGVLTVGNSAVYPPMSFLPTENADPADRVGFDIDIATAIADELGLEVVFQQESYEQYLPSLATGRLDVVQSAMQDLETRRETADFVDYMMTGPQLFTTVDRTDLKGLEDLCGGSVVLDTGDVGYRDALAVASEKVCDEPITVIDAAGTADALLQLDQGRADATIRGAEAVRFLAEDGKYMGVGEPLTSIPVGIAVDLENTALRDAIAAALQTLIDNGTYAEIGERWGLSDLLLTEVTINGAPVA